jgi:hypothetical protein
MEDMDKKLCASIKIVKDKEHLSSMFSDKASCIETETPYGNEIKEKLPQSKS